MDLGNFMNVMVAAPELSTTLTHQFREHNKVPKLSLSQWLWA